MHIRWAFPRLALMRGTITSQVISTCSFIVLNIPQCADGIFVSTKEHP